MPLSKNVIKHVRSLRLKKFRQKSGLFLVEGDKMARELLDQNRVKIREIFAVEDWLDQQPQAKLAPFSIHTVKTAELERISNLSTPNQVLLVCEQLPLPTTNFDRFTDIALFLENIQNPGNLGTIIRTALWFGITHIIGAPNCVDLYNPKVIQATMGAFAFIQYQVMDLDELKVVSQSIPIYATTVDGGNIFQLEPFSRGILAIGNESHGISEALKKFSQYQITIPAATQSRAESLNAGVAAGICMALFKKQHQGL